MMYPKKVAKTNMWIFSEVKYNQVINNFLEDPAQHVHTLIEHALTVTKLLYTLQILDS